MKKLLLSLFVLLLTGAGCVVRTPTGEQPVPTSSTAPLAVTKENIDLFTSTFKLEPADTRQIVEAGRSQSLRATNFFGQEVELFPEVRLPALGQVDNKKFLTFVEGVTADLPYVYFSVSCACGDNARPILIFDKRSKKFLHAGEVVSLLRQNLTSNNWWISPDGDRLAVILSSEHKYTVEIFDLATLQRLQTLPVPAGLSVYEKLNTDNTPLTATSSRWSSNDRWETALYKGEPDKKSLTQTRSVHSLLVLQLPITTTTLPSTATTSTLHSTSTLDAAQKK